MAMMGMESVFQHHDFNNDSPYAMQHEAFFPNVSYSTPNQSFTASNSSYNTPNSSFQTPNSTFTPNSSFSTLPDYVTDEPEWTELKPQQRPSMAFAPPVVAGSVYMNPAGPYGGMVTHPPSMINSSKNVVPTSSSVKRQSSPRLGPRGIHRTHPYHKPKAKRTGVACEECRKKKQKCDGRADSKTACHSCAEAKLECVYREVIERPGGNIVQQLLRKMEESKAISEKLAEKVEEFVHRLDSIERSLMVPFQCQQCCRTPVRSDDKKSRS